LIIVAITDYLTTTRSRIKLEDIMDDDIFDEVDRFKKRGDYTAERKELLKNVTGAEIDAEVMRLQAEHPERFLSRTELEDLKRAHTTQTTKHFAEMVGA